jgi:hypothetical protein
MADAASQAQTEAPGCLGRLRSRWSLPRLATFAHIGCLPLLVLGGLALIGLLVLITYRVPQPWITDAREWRISGRLSLILYGLISLQYVVSWILGLIAAAGGARVTAHGVDLRSRLRTAGREVRFAVFAVIGLRLLLIAALVVSCLYAFTYVFGPPIDVAGALDIERLALLRPLSMIVAGGLLVVHLLAGPWLRLRYSTRLGALAASYAKTREQRVWNALTARLGAGLTGALTLLWGSSIVSLVLSMILDPVFIPRPSSGLLELYPNLPSSLGQSLAGLHLSMALVAVVLIGQIVLPKIIMRRAERQLGARSTGEVPQ